MYITFCYENKIKFFNGFSVSSNVLLTIDVGNVIIYLLFFFKKKFRYKNILGPK